MPVCELLILGLKHLSQFIYLLFVMQSTKINHIWVINFPFQYFIFMHILCLAMDYWPIYPIQFHSAQLIENVGELNKKRFGYWFEFRHGFEVLVWFKSPSDWSKLIHIYSWLDFHLNLWNDVFRGKFQCNGIHWMVVYFTCSFK